MNEATKKTLTCIVCPMGCQIEVTLDSAGKVTEITGNTCKRGYDYAQNEFTNPTRTLTSTVRIKSETDKLLPVRTAKPIPKPKLFEAMKVINEIDVTAPVKIGDVIRSDFMEPGVDLIAAKTIEK